MTSNMIYEVKAEAFRRMTGHMAPGKDASPASYPAPLEDRAAAWDKWHADHRDILRAFTLALACVVPDEE